MKPLKNTLLTGLTILAVLAFAAFVVYIIVRGDPALIEQDLRLLWEDRSQLAGKGTAALEKGRDALGKGTAAIDRSANAAKKSAAAFQKSAEVIEKGAAAIEEARKLPGIGDALRLPARLGAAPGSVTVYFAPCREDAEDGIAGQLLALIRGAKSSIACALYDLEYMPVAEALIERHKAGVRVGVVSDSDYESRPAAQACIKAGIPVVFDNRGAFMHNKFCVVDGEWVWTGSTNVTVNCFFRNDNNALKLLSKELAANYQGEFDEMFGNRAFGAQSPRGVPFPEVQLGPARIECLFSPTDGVRKKVAEAVGAARQHVEFMAFSFTCREIARAMAEGVARGVSVAGVFEARNAEDPYSQDEFLAGSGAVIYLDGNPAMMHHKVIIIDGETVVTGSYNFSASAATKNDENLLIIHSPDIARQYGEEFRRIVAMATPVS